MSHVGSVTGLSCFLHTGLVVEDAPSGIRAGHAAGARTLAVCTSHTRQAIVDSGASPDYIVTDLTRVSVRLVDGKVEVSIDEDAE